MRQRHSFRSAVFHCFHLVYFYAMVAGINVLGPHSPHSPVQGSEEAAALPEQGRTEAAVIKPMYEAIV